MFTYGSETSSRKVAARLPLNSTQVHEKNDADPVGGQVEINADFDDHVLANKTCQKPMAPLFRAHPVGVFK